MACCKCCCEAGTPPGECCGSPSTCCKEPDICCGPSGSKECCEDPRVCCGVGSGQECCPEGDLCCGEECCPPSQECCGSGENQVCCNEGQYCCDGVCQDEPCDGCPPCDCVVPEGNDNADGLDGCTPELITEFGETFWTCSLGYGEFNGVGADMGIQWAPDYLEDNQDCGFVLQVVFDDDDVYWRLFKCNGDEWVDVSSEAFVLDDPNSDDTVYGSQWWCKKLNGDCDAPPTDDPPPCVPLDP